MIFLLKIKNKTRLDNETAIKVKSYRCVAFSDFFWLDNFILHLLFYFYLSFETQEQQQQQQNGVKSKISHLFQVNV